MINNKKVFKFHGSEVENIIVRYAVKDNMINQVQL
jgi:hypothetical protein